MSKIKISEETQQLLLRICNNFDKEDRAVRERQIMSWRKLKYYWEGFQHIWYSEVAHDWRTWDLQQASGAGIDNSNYDKPVNIFKAYLESIIAALSVSIPGIVCVPDDADNDLDLLTAKAGDKIAALIAKHNDVDLLWLHALYVVCTEGLVACYNYSKEDEKYGTYEEDVYEDQETSLESKICPVCQHNLSSREISNEARDEFDPGDEDVEQQDLLQKFDICPQCLTEMTPQTQVEKIMVNRLVGKTTKPKARQCLEVYGGLFVKVPNYAKKQKDIPYLILAYETHYSDVIERYDFLADKLRGTGNSSANSGMYDPYERWGRLSTQYRGEYPINTPTVRNCWLRPSAFNTIDDKVQRDALKKQFPNGAKVVIVNDLFAEACNESLDDHWTLTENPLADYLHHNPWGAGLVSIQDITNDLLSLVIQTIEHGIPQTFVDQEVIDTEEYAQQEVSPGAIYPAKARSGKSLGESFYEVKTSSLSPEVQPFMQKVQEAGQLVSGALPSLFGGAAPNSSKTAAQYAMSRAQALQRLQTQWKMLCVWWKNIFGKVIPQYIEDVEGDERYVTRNPDGGFINTYIRKAEMEGKIGSVELEASEQLPTTWAQKRDAIMQLMQGSNPEIMAALTSPENIPLVREAIGLPDFIIPGEDDRDKQFVEINQLVKSEPMVIPQPDPMMMGQMVPQELPSVEIEPEIDNHPIHIDICRRWLVSEVGRQNKIENPAGYKNVLLHLKAHMGAMQAMQPPPIAAGSGPQKVKPLAAPASKKNGQVQ